MMSSVRRKARYVTDGQQPNDQSAVEAEVRSELVASAYASVRRVACRLRDGVLTLHGQVPTYFLKQVAQNVVLQRLDRSVPIDNQVRVVTEGGR